MWVVVRSCLRGVDVKGGNQIVICTSTFNDNVCVKYLIYSRLVLLAVAVAVESIAILAIAKQ